MSRVSGSKIIHRDVYYKIENGGWAAVAEDPAGYLHVLAWSTVSDEAWAYVTIQQSFNDGIETIV